MCISYLSSNPGLSLNASSCSNLFSINSSEAQEAINVINTNTNHWIKVGEDTFSLSKSFFLSLLIVEISFDLKQFFVMPEVIKGEKKLALFSRLFIS